MHVKLVYAEILKMYQLILITFLILQSTRIESASVQQILRRTPDNQTATIGDTVTLACSIVNKQGMLQWTRDGFGLGTDRNLFGFERYRMVGSEEEGDYTLVIDSVTLEDDAIFQCQVGPGLNGVKGLRSANAKLTIEVPSSKPEILQGDFLELIENQEVQIECIARGGKPAAEITWLDGSNQVIRTNVHVFKELLEDGKRFNTRSILTLSPTKSDDNKTFTCQAHNRPSKDVTADYIKLSVKYSPKIKIQILNNGNIREGNDVKVLCKADANPNIDMSYKWFLNGQILPGESESSEMVVIKNLNRTNHKNIVKCEVMNSVGKSESSDMLLVKYGPKFVYDAMDIQADLNATVTLPCIVDGNPQPEIIWFHEKTRIVVSTQQNLTVAITPGAVGRYTCQAVTEGFDGISRTTNLFLKGPPKILSSKIQFGKNEELVQLECFAKSIPEAENVTWTFRGLTIVQDNNFEIKENVTNTTMKSTLIIKSAKDADFGPYNCTVVNAYGTRSMDIYLMKQRNPELVIVLTAVIASFVFIVAIAMATLLCHRKNPRKNDLKGPDLDLQLEKNNIKSDTCSNDSDLKIETRTASPLSNIQENESDRWNEDGSDQKNDSLYRYNDFIEQNYPPITNDGHNNNGYIPYGNFTPAPTVCSNESNFPPMNIHPSHDAPYVKIPNTNLPTLHTNGLLKPLNNTYPYQMPNYMNNLCRSSCNTPAPQAPTPLPLSTSTSCTTLHFIPSQMTHQLKPGTLSTHV